MKIPFPIFVTMQDFPECGKVSKNLFFKIFVVFAKTRLSCET
jgi:hypothetical protein